MAGIFQNTGLLIFTKHPHILIPCFLLTNGGFFCKFKEEKMQKAGPHIINSALLWEYDLETFNYEKSYKIVIERVLERGNLEEWREMVQLYKREQILETIEWSAQLDQRDKDFAIFFLPSGFLKP
jgi:hypothetical protein